MQKAIFACLLMAIFSLQAQQPLFRRTELAPDLQIPWDIEYGPDGFLWLTESQGRISRIDPNTGTYRQIWKAPDYRDAAPSEKWPLCYGPMPGSGCLGLALDPDFMTQPAMYVFYSYHDTINNLPKTRFKIAQVVLNNAHDTVISFKNIVMHLPTGFDHLGGRLLCIKTEGRKYLYVSVGDNGISETAQPSCYAPQDSNPNNKTWDPYTLNGKILRYYTDGSIPPDNPIPGNPFYTRGHRNPQGLAWNPETGIVYESEHGDRTDDEINILQKGLNYGWKWIRGWHADNNWPGEKDSVEGFDPRPEIPGDRLEQPVYVWCASDQPLSVNNADWCTVAPSGAAWYGSGAIAFLRNSLLVTTLKNGDYSRQEVYAFHFEKDGHTLAPSVPENPNPRHLFTGDADINGRLRDIAISPDGKKIYLINNAGIGSIRDKITVYTFQSTGTVLYPNPTRGICHIQTDNPLKSVEVYDGAGRKVLSGSGDLSLLDLSEKGRGMFVIRAVDTMDKTFIGRLLVE